MYKIFKNKLFVVLTIVALCSPMVGYAQTLEQAQAQYNTALIQVINMLIARIQELQAQVIKLQQTQSLEPTNFGSATPIQQSIIPVDSGVFDAQRWAFVLSNGEWKWNNVDRIVYAGNPISMKLGYRCFHHNKTAIGGGGSGGGTEDIYCSDERYILRPIDDSRLSIQFFDQWGTLISKQDVTVGISGLFDIVPPTTSEATLIVSVEENYNGSVKALQRFQLLMK